MIYSSSVNFMNESDIDSLLENANDRFEYETMAEATAIVVREQEENWTRFMTGIGLSELSTVMEGQEVIYEGARLQKFFEKAKAYFKMAMNKLAEITKAFIAKLDSLFRSNAGFIKKYKSKILNAKLTDDFEFKGYKFTSALDKEPVYTITMDKEVTDSNASSIISMKERLSGEEAEKDFIKAQGGTWEDSMSESLTNLYFGDKTKESLEYTDIDLRKQVEYVEGVKKAKDSAKKSYTKAHAEHKKIISKLESAEKKALNKTAKDTDNLPGFDEAYGILIGYWKAWSSAATTGHGTYMRALGTRARQAKAICTKALNFSNKNKGKAERERIKAKTESGYVNADAFLGAVEFI